MAYGNDKVITPASSQALIGQLRARRFKVTAVDTAEFSKTDGVIHCMAQAFRRAK